ncbi:MAG: DUF1571 domain-containing protein [Planctomycetaceae bacterium]
MVAQSVASTGKKHQLDPYIRMAQGSRKSLDKVADYVATFVKMEVVNGKAYANTMQMKFREKPFSVYLYFRKAHLGRQVLYAAGKNGNMLLAKEAGIGALAGTVALKPGSPRALKEGLFPITRIGMANMLDGVIAQWKAERTFANIKVTYFPNASLKRPDKTLKPIECKVLQSVNPNRGPRVKYSITRLYIDKKTNLPVRVEQYGFPKRPGDRPPLLAEYTYWNVRTNVGLKDIDFDRKNPRYKL